MYLNVYAPHQPATPAPQRRDQFPARRRRARRASTLDVTGKPQWLQRSLPHAAAQADRRASTALYRVGIRSLQAVDRGVATLIDTLRATGQLDNTYFVFSSDNGFHLGQFRMPAGKETAYDSDIHVPLIVRGPGVPAGETQSASWSATSIWRRRSR